MSFLRAYVKFSTRLTLLWAGFKKHALLHLILIPQESWLLDHQVKVMCLDQWLVEISHQEALVLPQGGEANWHPDGPQHTQGDWAEEFTHKPNEEHSDFTKDREDIKMDTDRICGGNKDIALVWVMLGINHQKGGGSNYFGLGESEFAMLATTQLQIRRISPLCGTSSWRTR